MSNAVSRFILALFFVGAGVGHFVSPALYLSIMPPYLPGHRELVAISGAAEILGGLAICFPPTRFWAGWGLIALLVAVFPANIQAILTGMIIGGHAVPPWMLWARLPFEPLLITWVYYVCVRTRQRNTEPRKVNADNRGVR